MKTHKEIIEKPHSNPTWVEAKKNLIKILFRFDSNIIYTLYSLLDRQSQYIPLLRVKYHQLLTHTPGVCMCTIFFLFCINHDVQIPESPSIHNHASLNLSIKFSGKRFGFIATVE